MKKCKYLEENVDAGSGARGVVFPSVFPATSHLYESRKRSISNCIYIYTPLAQRDPFTFPRLLWDAVDGCTSPGDA